MGVWRNCRNPNHHIQARPAEGKFVVQMQYNTKRVSQIFDNLEDAKEWRDAQLKAFQRPIFQIAPPVLTVPAIPEAPKEKRLKNNSRINFTNIAPVIGAGKIVTFD
jgi:hypothetical protein